MMYPYEHQVVFSCRKLGVCLRDRLAGAAEHGGRDPRCDRGSTQLSRLTHHAEVDPLDLGWRVAGHAGL